MMHRLCPCFFTTAVAGVHPRMLCPNWIFVTVSIYWPKGVISSRELYRRCGVCPITERVRKARWMLFGHILRMDNNCPASVALHYAVETLDTLTGRRGRPRTNLFSVLVNDLKEYGASLKNLEDLHYLKCLAHNRTVWRNMFVMKQYEG